MALSQQVIRIFVAAPGDITDERTVIGDVVGNWNTHRGTPSHLSAEVVWWRNRARPRMGVRPQEAINVDVLDDADIVVGIFWTRFGTPTGVAESGTEEELRRSIKAGKNVLLYFCDRPVKPSEMDAVQYAKVQAFKREIQATHAGLYWEYSDIDTFREEFSRHIATSLDKFVATMASAATANDAGPRPEAKMETHVVPGMGETFAPQIDGLDSYMPAVKKTFTDRDRVKFIEQGFRDIREFMKAALARLQTKEPLIETDFLEVTAVQFACRVYKQGSLVSQCKVWTGQQLGSMGIYYATDNVEAASNNSFNDWLTLEDDGLRLFFRANGIGGWSGQGEQDVLSAAEVGPYLWRKLTAVLGQR